MSIPDGARASIRHDTVDPSAPLDESADHRGLRPLDLEECLELLRSTPVGRLAFVSEGEPVMFPVNHRVDGSDIVFRTSWGSKLRVAETSGSVAFEVDGYDTVRERGWSVLAKGSAQLVFDSGDIERYDALGVRSWPDVKGLGFWVRIRPTEITGREVPPASG